jgi:hypothetical protein
VLLTICNDQFRTLVKQMKQHHAGLLLYLTHIPGIFHLPANSLNLCKNPSHLEDDLDYLV